MLGTRTDRDDLAAAVLILEIQARRASNRLFDTTGAATRAIGGAMFAFLGLVGGYVFFGQLFVAGVDIGSAVAPNGLDWKYPDGSIEMLGIGALVVFFAGAYFGAATAVEKRYDHVDPMIGTTASPEAVAIGRLLPRIVGATLFFAPASLAFHLGFGIGTMSVLVGLLGFVGSLFTALLGVLSGYIAVATGLSAVGRDVLPLRLRLAVHAVLLFGGLGLVQVLLHVDGIESTPGFDQLISLASAYASVGLVSIDTDLEPLGILLVVVSLPALFAGVPTMLRMETNRFRRLNSQPRGQHVPNRPAPIPFRFTLSTRVAWQHLLRTARDPRTRPIALMLIGLPVFSWLFTGIEDGIQLELLGATVVFCGIVAAGTYCQNPLGDDRPQRPLILTSLRSPLAELHGRIIASGVLASSMAFGIGIPLVLIGGTVYHPAAVIGFALLMLAASIGSALGLGAVVPNTESRELFGIDVVPPSVVATIGHLFGSLFVPLIGLVPLWLITTGGLDQRVAAVSAVYLTVVVGVAAGGYLYARRKAASQYLAP